MIPRRSRRLSPRQPRTRGAHRNRSRGAVVVAPRRPDLCGRDDARRLAATTIVLAAGLWSGRLARTAGIRLPLEGGKGYHVDFAADAAQPSLPCFLQEAHVTMTPLSGRMRLTGGLDLCGFDMSVDQRRVDAIVSAARRTLAPEATATVREVWRGLRPCTPDGLPYVGRLRDVEGLVVCTGHAMLGLTLAPVSARLVADLVDGLGDYRPCAVRSGALRAIDGARSIVGRVLHEPRASDARPDLLVRLAQEIGVRQCGTDAAAQAARVIAEAFRDLGLEPRFQEFPLLRFDAEEPELWVDGERWPVGPCIYAHPGVCEGPVERLSDGHWAVGEGRLIRSIFGKGPIPFTGRGPAGGHVATPPTAFLSRDDDARLREGRHARLVVRGAWAMGHRDRNVIATIPGAKPEKVVVGAHFDSVWRGNGAIDNATGVEGIRRVAERFAGRQLPRTLEFVAFAAEEVGLIGARRYVAEAGERELARRDRRHGQPGLHRLRREAPAALRSPRPCSTARRPSSSGSAWRSATTSSRSSARRPGPTTSRLPRPASLR